MNTKTRFLAAAIAALTISLPRAGAAEDIDVGLKMGFNLSGFYGKDANPPGISSISRMGFTGGAFFVYPAAKGIDIQPEFLLSTKGTIYKMEILGEPYEQTISLTYLDIPVLLRMNLTMPRQEVIPYFLLGPVLSIKTSARSEVRTLDGATSGDVDHIKSLDLGGALGAGIEMPTGKGAIVFEMRYTLGLNTIAESSGGRTAEIKNKSFAFTAGYRF